jgi:hypothetical protein
MSLAIAPHVLAPDAAEAPRPAASEDPALPPDLTTAPRPARSGLVLELAAVADPVRAARRLSALVNNTRVALTELTAAGTTAYPVPIGAVTADGPVLARFSLREAGATVDRLLQEELVSLVSSTHRVLTARRVP